MVQVMWDSYKIKWSRPNWALKLIKSVPSWSWHLPVSTARIFGLGSGCFWSVPIKSGRPHLVQVWPIWAQLAQCCAVWPHLASFGPVWHCLAWFGPIKKRDFHWNSAIYGNLGYHFQCESLLLTTEITLGFTILYKMYKIWTMDVLLRN